MKNTLAIVAALLLASPAFASKARLSALGNADHLTDVQTTFTTPTDLLALGDWATFEMGTAGVAAIGSATGFANPNAEGGFIRAMGDAKLGFYLGHHDSKVMAARFSSGVTLAAENPINIMYAKKMGAMSWGLNLGYAAGQKKTGAAATQSKNDMTTLNASVSQDAWSAEIGTVLVDKVKFEGGGADYKGKSQIHAKGAYTMDSMFYSLTVDTAGGENDTSKAAREQTTITLQAIDTRKVDGGQFFYGLGVKNDTLKVNTTATASTKNTTMSLPFMIGVEADATSWMVLRGSVTQNVLISSNKLDTEPVATTDGTDTVTNNTTVAAGAGIKFGKMMFDASLAGSTTGTVNGNSLFANGALTYTF
jgi:hypothetical protein